jgi:hypothetical protein
MESEGVNVPESETAESQTHHNSADETGTGTGTYRIIFISYSTACNH